MKKAITTLGILLVLASAALAQKKGETEVAFGGFTWGAGEVVEINADKMNLTLKEHQANFEGNVLVKKAASSIYCDRLSVKYLESGQINWLKAADSVKISQGKSFATGDELEYFKDQNKIYLHGNPRLVSEGQIVMGDSMVFDLTANKLLVTNPRIQFSKEENEPVKK